MQSFSVVGMDEMHLGPLLPKLEVHKPGRLERLAPPGWIVLRLYEWRFPLDEETELQERLAEAADGTQSLLEVLDRDIHAEVQQWAEWLVEV